MPCSLVYTSWPPPFILFNKTYTKHPNIILRLVNPSSKTLYLSTLTHFPSPLYLTSQSSVSCLPVAKSDTAKSNEKLRAELFADKINATPLPERSKFIYSMLEKHGGLKNIGYYNDVIMGLVIAEEFELALKLFDEMPRGLSPDCWTYSVLIRCYCKKGEPDEGMGVLDCMVENGFRPNVVTLTILVNAFCSRGKIQRAFDVVEMMSGFGCEPNVQTYNCVLKGLCYVGRVEEAYEMLMGLKKKGEDSEMDGEFANIYSYTAVMDGLCKVGRSDEAMELLEEAIELGLSPNVITYNTLFNGYCKEGKPRKGVGLLKQMKEGGCKPDYISYSTLLHGLLKWDKIMAAFWVYREMVEVGFKVDERMMNTLLRGLCRKSWAEEELLPNVDEVFGSMKSWSYAIFPDTYYQLVQTFCIQDVDKALVVLYEMVEAGYFPRMVTINRVIRGLCEEERVAEALSVLVLVRAASRIPSKISYNILIDELNRTGNVLGACNVYGAALKLGVIPHRTPLCIQQS